MSLIYTLNFRVTLMLHTLSQVMAGTAVTGISTNKFSSNFFLRYNVCAWEFIPYIFCYQAVNGHFSRSPLKEACERDIF